MHKLMAREEFCDYYFGENSFYTESDKIQRYYNGFVDDGAVVVMRFLRPIV